MIDLAIFIDLAPIMTNLALQK